MKIYINEKNEIKDINETSNTELIELEVDREEVFGDMSDFLIKNYKYVQNENGSFIEPYTDIFTAVQEDFKLKINETYREVNVLKKENEELWNKNKILEEEIQVVMATLIKIYELNEDVLNTTDENVEYIYNKLNTLKINN